jgi:hypothetical protein
MREIEERTMVKYAQTLSAQDRDSSKLVRAPPAHLCLRTLKSSAQCLDNSESFLGCSRNSDELSAATGTEWKHLFRSLIVRSVDGLLALMGTLACQTLLCPFNPAYILPRKCPSKTLQPPISSYAPYVFQCLEQTNNLKIPRRGTSWVCFLQLSVAVVKSTDRYCR